MSYYGGTVTVAGRNLITSLMAGKTIEFTRIMVGLRRAFRPSRLWRTAY